MKKSPIANEPHIQLVDAGLDFNLPYPPISGQRPQRAADVIIFLDASKTIKDAPSLRKAEQYARRHNLKFPKINYTGIATRVVSVFKDKDPQLPIVVYMPRVVDKQLHKKYAQDPIGAAYVRALEDFDIDDCTRDGFCQTGNMQYTAEQSRQLSTFAEFNMWASRDTLVSVLRDALKRKNKKRKRKRKSRMRRDLRYLFRQGF